MSFPQAQRVGNLNIKHDHSDSGQAGMTYEMNTSSRS